jgi:glycine cleavage system H lipoate-binding protein
MPGMDGVQVTRPVRHLPPDIDVIAITGYGKIESAVDTVKSGAMDYVQKPFTEDELVGMVNAALIRRQARQERQMRQKVRLIKPGVSESKFELNVPAGVFISPQHAWAKIEMDGTVRVGLDDFIRKLFDNADSVELPEEGQTIAKGDRLFALRYGDFSLDIPSPLSGTVTAVNSEHVEHPEWLAIKPFELSWVCGLEPSNLKAELADLRIGHDSMDWCLQEIERYRALSRQQDDAAQGDETNESEPTEQEREADALELLIGFSEPFRQP